VHDVGHYKLLYLKKQRGGDDHKSCTVIFIGARHIHGHCGDHLNRFAYTALSGNARVELKMRRQTESHFVTLDQD
jgi:hypothetical protein